MKKLNLLLVVLVLASMVLAACGGSQGNANTGEEPEVPAAYAGKTNPLGPEAADAGKVVYETYCASCHGPEGHGDGPAAAALDPKPENLGEVQAKFDDDFIFWRISEGVEGTAMVGWATTLSEEEIWQVISFMHTLSE